MPCFTDPIIIDARQPSNNAAGASTLRREVIKSLTQKTEPKRIDNGHPDGVVSWTKSLPLSVLYEDKGIEFYERFTREPGYYLFEEELSVLQQHVNKIVDQLFLEKVHVDFIDLGAGRLDKSACLIEQVSRRAARGRIHSTYYAVDLQFDDLKSRLSELVRTTSNTTLEDRKGHVTLRGVCGSYLDAVRVLNAHIQPRGNSAKCFLWLGSSFTNSEPHEVIQFLKDLREAGNFGPEDMLLVGVDHCTSGKKVLRAYSQDCPVWRAYIKNGIRNAGVVLGLGSLALRADEWEYVARWDEDTTTGHSRHVRFARCPRTMTHQVEVADINTPEPDEKESMAMRYAEGEYVFMAQSYKYTPEAFRDLVEQSGLQIVDEWDRQRQGVDAVVYLLKLG